MIENLIKNELKTYYPEMIKLRRYMHMHPEVSFNEKNTAEFINNYLLEIGIKDIKTNIGLHGIVARIKGQDSSKTIAFRADFDALSINLMYPLSLLHTECYQYLFSHIISKIKNF